MSVLRSTARALEPGLLAAAVVVALLACRSSSPGSSGEPSPAPPTSVSVTAQPAVPVPGPAPAPIAAQLRRAEIHAGTTAGGQPRRGIVRSGAEFRAPELARLDNGTAVGVVERLHGGWLKIRWPFPSGENEGFIHEDVVSLDGETAAKPVTPRARARRPAPTSLPEFQPDQRGPCSDDSDCRRPYRCGFQGNCMLL